MPIEFRCSQCNNVLRVPDQSEGAQARCPYCQHVSQVPAPRSERADAAAENRPNEPVSRYAGFYPPPKDAYHPAANTGGQAPSASGFSPPAAAPFETTAPGGPSPLQLALTKVAAPATGMVFSAAICVSQLSAMYVSTLKNGAMQAGLPKAVFVSGLALGAAVYFLVFYGARKMRRLESYRWSVAASVLSMLPCSFCCPVSFLFGLWSLVMLLDIDVKRGFALARETQDVRDAR